ncbi:DNA replication/repair protein RecF [Candidatus Hydrogenosomobacter endosymbioticus]|uniref:DNA replication and repair protein RecF n=1 Tax=Candidatus Hydrogenosomobacter endosymbioticus TaxID=2558174 RepID=A0ABM7V8E5_9PROT|nr:DNA replication/repair protein RecF [Candidatus Hydrogenosomobacter endosymbioticus]BDB96057.1 DNA replication and repair protein RecF [Candidatus Hydrogenosomobacter endosymbioticus]
MFSNLRISLESFRSYKSLNMEFPFGVVCLHGKNGIGKTNLLEALSLLSPGRGMRKVASNSVFQNNSANTPWRAQIEFITDSGPLRIMTTANAASNRREIYLNDVLLKKHSDIADLMSLNWITPTMDKLFSEGKTARRRFFDRITFSIFPKYADHIISYEKAMRERQYLLAENRYSSSSWCDCLESLMAENAIAIAEYRMRAISLIESEIRNCVNGFPKATFSLTGEFENLIKENFCQKAKESFIEMLKTSRSTDSGKSGAKAGIHKTLFSVTHENGQEASLCSTGEQKAILVSIILAVTIVSKKMEKDAITMLLIDEVAAHLDDDKRERLFDELISMKISVWLTGTDAGIFSSMLGRAHVVDLEKVL